MALAMTLGLRALSLVGVLFAVLLLVVVTLGATGFSDRMITAIVQEEMRGTRTSLAQTIRDPVRLEEVIEDRTAELERFYGLDRSWYTRLPSMVLRVLTLDLGSARNLRSFDGSSRVIDIVAERVPYSMLLITTSMTITATLGLWLGAKLSTRVGTKLDRTASYLGAASNALPAWWAGILMIFVLSFQLGLFPSGGLYSVPPPTGGAARMADLLWHALLPVMTLVLVSVGAWTYIVRTMLLNTAQEFFVTAARARGLPERTIMQRHILRVAAPPIATNIILGLTASLGGAILTETVFNWPGMGRLYFDAITTADEGVIVALTFIFTLMYVMARFVLELLYVVLDPRIRYTAR
ncbi:MAG: ABC transporter permease [Chloroflexi bacterium]|nr:ABC transporter permease [Chloroflexota bacterium]